MSIPTSRRAMLAGAATLSAASAVNLAAIVATRADPIDAELLVLGEKLRAAQKAIAAQSARNDKREAAYKAREIPMPEVCRAKPGDEEAIGIRPGYATHDGFYGSSQVETIRKLSPEMNYCDVSGDTPRWARRQRDRARIAEIIEAFEEWAEADDALRRETEFDRVDDDNDKVVDAQADVMLEIAATPARTMDGLRVKAMAALACQFDRPENIYDERPECEGSDTEDALSQLCWDILEMTGGPLAP